MIVEVQDFLEPNVSIKARFASSHRIEEVVTTPRDPSAYPELRAYSNIGRRVQSRKGA